ncbi:uncharacterized protein LOC144435835 [Glandiceps talaboti]
MESFGRFVFAAAVLTAVLLSVEAHVCLISPPQRGSMQGLNKAGSDDCILTNGPCGGRMKMTPQQGVRLNANYTVTWQKNLDHYNQAMPGQFIVSIGGNDSSQQEFIQLHKQADDSQPSLTLYSFNVTMPKSVPYMVGVIQIQYVTDNPQAPAVFYQCSDVFLMS